MKYAFSTAEFDKERPELYRYSLERLFSFLLPRLPQVRRTVLFVGLNPSTATAEEDDPTIRREVGYAQDWCFDRYLKGNVYALRSTDPSALYDSVDPVGPHNKATLKRLMDRADLIVAAWGANKLHPAAVEIAQMILADPRTRCLGVTKGGAPKHPLYLSKTTPLQMVAPAKGYIAL